MPKALVLIASIATSFALGCKGCKEKAPPPEREETVQASTQPTQADEAKLNFRLHARKLDPNKPYAKNPDGSVACGEDVDCFVLQAENCTNAALKNTLRIGAFGIDQRVEAEYRITAKAGNRCKLRREVGAVGASLDPQLEEALRKQGKTADDLATLKEDNERTLRKHYPGLVECAFQPDEVLSVALDIAEGRPDQRPWLRSCTELPSAAPGESAPTAAPQAVPAPTAAPKPSEEAH